MKAKPNNFVDLQVRTSVDSGEIMALLSDHDPLGSWESDGVIHFYWSETTWNARILKDLRAGLDRMGIVIGDAEIEIALIPDQDWNLRWAENIRPIRIGRSILIRQSWSPPDIPFEGVTLILDPKRAFGSGYHATTQLLVEYLEDRIRGGETVLDVGTGSGILAMIALRLGASFALGIDIDPEAIECARENAINNDFGPELELKTASLEEMVPRQFDWILANLDRKSLMENSGRIKKYLKSGGKAFFSGLLVEDRADIEESIALCGGQVLERRERDEWMALEVTY